MSIEKALKQDINRREFLQTGLHIATALSGLELIAGCAPFDKPVSPKEFNIQSFNRWYVRNKLYNKRNSYLGAQSESLTFEDNIRANYTPGVSYCLRRGDYMVAVAQGSVGAVVELQERPGRHAGLMVSIRHPEEGDYCYYSVYAHLDDSLVKENQFVHRGDKVGHVYTYTDTIKLILKEGLLGRKVDPDNYGKNHSYMNYWDLSSNLEIKNQYKKLKAQENIANSLKESFTASDKEEPPEADFFFTKLQKIAKSATHGLTWK
jgi:hypothetical protein